MSRVTPYLKNGLVMLVGILVALLLLEWAFRFYIDRFGLPEQKASYLYSIEDIVRERWRFAPQAYTNFGLSPLYPSHNSLGFRGPEMTREKPEGVYRIVAVGGSTTYGHRIGPWQQAYPAKLQDFLHEAGYTNVQVVNAGVGGYSSWDSLVNVALRVLDLDPDLLLYYEATNDVTFRLVDPQHFNGANPARGIWNPDLQPLPPSALYRFIALRLGWMTFPGLEEWALRPIEPIEICWSNCTLDGKTPDELIEANDARYYRRNLVSIIAMAQAHNVDVMLSTWAYFPDPIPNESNYMTLDYRVRGVEQNNEIMRELAQAYDTLFYDLAETMPYDISLWFEGVHMNPMGTREQARQYAEYLISSGVLPAPEG
jgi:hypothetical protein